MSKTKELSEIKNIITNERTVICGVIGLLKKADYKLSQVEDKINTLILKHEDE